MEELKIIKTKTKEDAEYQVFESFVKEKASLLSYIYDLLIHAANQ